MHETFYTTKGWGDIGDIFLETFGIEQGGAGGGAPDYTTTHVPGAAHLIAAHSNLPHKTQSNMPKARVTRATRTHPHARAHT